MNAPADSTPALRMAQTDDLNHRYGATEDVPLDEQTAILHAMSLETPSGALESPNSSPPGTCGTPGLTASMSTPTAPISPTLSSSEKSKASHMFKTALQDVRYFAGGLISHPYESTKHYSILRHSHGLVYYTGSFTNLAITIFSDREIPADRTLWLQRKGFSGKAGLKLGSLLGARSTWIDVTPAVRATPDQLNPSDERAWQRDIQKFLKKAPKDIASHRVRETDILRIPCEADDGYLRIVLCTAEGKKVLCGSPIFRLASSSTDGSSIRGASLMTLPLEVGLKIGSVVANNAVAATLSPVAETARTFVTDQVARVYQPSALAQQALTSAYDSSGVQGRIDNANVQYDETRATAYSRLASVTYDALARPAVVGDDLGPASPFPVRFHGKVIPGSGASKARLNMPTANLTGVGEDVLLRYHGAYFGWAAVSVPKKLAAETSISDEWHPAVIFIGPDPHGRRTVVQQNSVRAYVVHGFMGALFFDAKLSVMLMGFLRGIVPPDPGEEPDVDAQLFDFYKDIAVTTASLSRPAWAADATLARVRSAASSRSMGERYVELRHATQKHVDRVPVHRLGIRTESAALRDQLVGTGGVCVPRQPLYNTLTA